MKPTLKSFLTKLTPGGASRPGQVRLEGVAKSSLDMGRNRVVATGAIFSLAFLAVGWRLIDVSVMQPNLTRARHAMPVSALATRAEIVDRNGVVLATRRPIQSLFADPSLIAKPDRLVRRLSRLLPGLKKTSRRALLRRLSDRQRRFVWIARDVPAAIAERIVAMKEPGLEFRREWRRTWPQGAVVGHIVGFTDVDGRGIVGIERKFDRRLNDNTAPLRLSIDIRVQMALRDVIGETVRRFRAKGGSALMMDVRTGELLGMVSWPDFEPSAPGKATVSARFNRNTLGVYEMGSTFKIFTIAMAYDSGLYKEGDRVDARRPIRIRKFSIRDYHAKKRWLSIREVFIYSSNIGSAKIALRAGRQRLQSFLRKLGLMQRPPLELPEVGAPLVPRHWRPVHTMTVAFGHGMAVSPIQLAAAVAGIANGGTWRAATLMKQDAAALPAGRRVVSRATSLRMRSLLRQVVEKGTGRKAEAPGYRVGGKTGTAEKAGRRGYRRNKLLSSFVGVFPIDDPRYVVLVTVDEPKGNKSTHGYATGGWVAAPAVRAIILRTAPILGLRPSRENVDGVPAVQPNTKPGTPPGNSPARRTAPAQPDKRASLAGAGGHEAE